MINTHSKLANVATERIQRGIGSHKHRMKQFLNFIIRDVTSHGGEIAVTAGCRLPSHRDDSGEYVTVADRNLTIPGRR
jgi:hypothetical protein